MTGTESLSMALSSRHRNAHQGNPNHVDPSSTSNRPHLMKVCELKPLMKKGDISALEVIVLEITPPAPTKDRHRVARALVADESGSVFLSVWDDDIEALAPGDILRITGGYTSLFKDVLNLYTGQHGVLMKIGEFKKRFRETPNISTLKWVRDPSTGLFSSATPAI